MWGKRQKGIWIRKQREHQAPGNLLDAHHRLGDVEAVVSYFLEIRQQVDEHQARIDAAFTGAQP